MSRLRQYFANRYTSSEATNSEFENIIRYLNAAEVGNYTLAELLDKLFDSSGNVDVGLGLRFNPATGIEFMTDSAAQNWTLLAATADVRGVSGQNVGTVEAPLFSNRVDFTSGAGQTVYSYTTTSAASNVMVWVNGVMKALADYTYASGSVTLSAAPTTGSLVSIATIRTSPATAFRRVDLVASSAQVTFPFAHTSTEEIVVYRNGVLQREGGGYDYIKSYTTATITMTTAQTSGNIITIICITNNLIREVTGLMMEDKYATGGLINLGSVNIPDAALSQAKVSGLSSALAGKAKITVAASPPGSPAQGDLWVNTSYAVPTLMFYDGARWLNSSPNGMIPLPLSANALQFLRLNSTATALEYSPFATGSLVQLSSVGSANGVAALDSDGKVPPANLPAYVARAPIVGYIAGALANGTYVIGHITDNAYSFDGITAKLTSGTATIQLSVGGVLVGSTLGATATTTKQAITPTASDATAAPKDVAIVVTGAATPVGLTYNIGCAITG